MVQQGPAAAWLKSSTFTPSRGNMLSLFKNQKSKVKVANKNAKIPFVLGEQTDLKMSRYFLILACHFAF
jgi:hypothetical protein